MAGIATPVMTPDTLAPRTQKADIEEEVDKFVASMRPSIAVPGVRIKRAPDPSVSADTICSRAMAILDERGAGALTLRSLAADLHISTRTLYKRIKNRENLLRLIAATYADGLDVRVRPGDSWRATSLAWSRQLRSCLTAHPHLSNLLGDEIIKSLGESIDGLVNVAVSEGVPRPRAAGCLRSLVRVTVNDALAEIRAVVNGGPAEIVEPHEEDDFLDTIGLLLDGVHERSRRQAPIRSSSRGRVYDHTPPPDRRGLAKMDRAGQASFAWSLLDAATPVITDESRAWLATKIGAGELEGAIVDLLRHLEFHGRTLTAAVHGQAQTWLNGYLGNDREAALRTLVDRIRIT